MRRVISVALASGTLVGCPDLSGLSSNFDASIDAPVDAAAADVAQEAAEQDVSADVTQSDCGIARRVQFAHYNNTSSNPDAGISLLLPLAQSAGDFIVATVNYSVASCGAASVSDTKGNNYVKLIPADVAPSTGSLETWGAQNVAAADLGQNTVTVSFAQTCTSQAMKVVHYTGIATSAAVESTSTEHGDGGTPTHTLAVTAPALLFAHTADQGAAYEAGVGWSYILIDDWATLAEERDALEAGAYLVDYTHSAENWVIQGIALRRCQ